MSMIQVKDLTFAYEGSAENIFSNVSFVLDTSWKLGFTGRNGRGKTTFLNLLMGRYPYQGSITSKEKFAYFPYQVEDEDAFVIDVLHHLLPSHSQWEFEKELSQLDSDANILYQPFSLLSKGQQTKVLIAAMFLKEDSFLLIDEPTNHLDAEGRERLSEYLKKKQGFILVSHDRAFLDGCVDHILAINRENIEVQQGNFSSWWKKRQQADAAETAKNSRLKKDIDRLQRSARQKADWSDQVEKTKIGSKGDKGYIGHKAAKMMKRATVIEARKQSAIEEKSSLLKNVESAETLEIHSLDYHSDVLCFAKGLTIQYGSVPIVENISFEIRKGEIVALKGSNGSGKSSVLKLICGYDIPHCGEIHTGSGIRISCVSQNTDDLTGTLSQYAQKKKIEYTRFLTLLRKLGFSREMFEISMDSYSAGQKKKVLLAGSLCEEAHLYIWDEPLNYIDVISRMQIEQMLKQADLTMLFVEHDQQFSETVAMRTIQI